MHTHLIAYSETTGGAETNQDTTAPADGVIQIRNGHPILSDEFNLIGAAGIGATISRYRFSNPSMIAQGIPHIWPLNVSATVPDRPWVVDYRDAPIKLPLDEEIAVEHTNGAADQVAAFLWVAKPEWRQSFPAHSRRLVVRATATTSGGSETGWSTPVAVAMERDLMQGVYAVVGCNVVAASALAFRLSFPSQRLVNGRQLRPGGLVQNTATTLPGQFWMGGLGEWGRFHTFELPSVQTFADNAATALEIRLDLLYIGRDRTLVYG